jgi:hypothetical protein
MGAGAGGRAGASDVMSICLRHAVHIRITSARAPRTARLLAAVGLIVCSMRSR